VSTLHGLIRRAEWHINEGKESERDDSATGLE
jgi:hypothetical protein